MMCDFMKRFSFANNFFLFIPEGINQSMDPSYLITDNSSNILAIPLGAVKQQQQHPFSHLHLLTQIPTQPFT